MPVDRRLEQARRAFDLARAGIERQPDRPALVRPLREAHRALTQAQLQSGDVAAAGASTQELVDLCPRDPACLRQAAGVLCECSSGAAQVGTGPAASADAADYVSRALTVLEAALQSGFSDRQNLLTSVDLAPLRQEPRFAVLMASLER
jgi:hypothetical protein